MASDAEKVLSVVAIKRRYRVADKKARGECRYCHRVAWPFTRCELHRQLASKWRKRLTPEQLSECQRRKALIRWGKGGLPADAVTR